MSVVLRGQSVARLGAATCATRAKLCRSSGCAVLTLVGRAGDFTRFPVNRQ